MNAITRCLIPASVGSLLLTVILTASATAQSPAEHRQKAPQGREDGVAVLGAVSASSSTDVWEIGRIMSHGSNLGPVIEHFDGAAWTSEAGAEPLGNLSDVFALSPDDVWVVGDVYRDAAYHPLAEHWDGSAWSVAATRDPGHGAYLTSVSATGPRDVWFVGASSAGPIAEHWNGRKFSVQSPSQIGQPGTDMMSSVAAVSRHVVLAVGDYGTSTGHQAPLTELWDGASWQNVPNEDPDATRYEWMGGMSADSASDAWAVGNVKGGSGRFRGYGFIEHFDGTQWSLVDAPRIPSSLLADVSALSPHDVWVVGAVRDSVKHQTLTLHWDGSTWARVKSPDLPPPDEANQVIGVSAVTATSVWNVGQAYDTATKETVSFSQHWNGKRWTTEFRSGT